MQNKLWESWFEEGIVPPDRSMKVFVYPISAFKHSRTYIHSWRSTRDEFDHWGLNPIEIAASLPILHADFLDLRMDGDPFVPFEHIVENYDPDNGFKPIYRYLKSGTSDTFPAYKQTVLGRVQHLVLLADVLQAIRKYNVTTRLNIQNRPA